MATADATKIHLARATLYVGTTGVEPATVLGYRPRETVLSVMLERDVQKFYAETAELPLEIRNDIVACRLEAGLWQIEPDVLAAALSFHPI